MTEEKTLNKIIRYLQSGQNLKPIVASILNNRGFYESIVDHSRDSLLVSLQNMFVSECVKANQYVRIGSIHSAQIYKVYEQLVEEIQDLLLGTFDASSVLHLVGKHRERLIVLLGNIDDKELFNEIVPCAEYSVGFQKSILRIGQNVLSEPILDVGCGRRHSLVSSLLQNGYSKVYGLDQYASTEPFILSGNWIEWNFGEANWGTIVSHMAFSNHCRNAIFLRKNDEIYRSKYHELLGSLKIGGTFIYTPRVMDFENDLDGNQFIVSLFQNSSDRDLDTVIVERAF